MQQVDGRIVRLKGEALAGPVCYLGVWSDEESTDGPLLLTIVEPDGVLEIPR